MLVAPWIGPIVVALAAGIVVALLLVVVQASRIGRLRRRLDGLSRNAEGRSLDAHLDRVREVGRELDEMAVRTAVVEANGKRAFQRYGIVRFNPFEETGGNQSFAVALLDGNGDGVVISSLHARAGTRVYAKELSRGRSEAQLSDEETEAVKRAMVVRPGDR